MGTSYTYDPENIGHKYLRSTKFDEDLEKVAMDLKTTGLMNGTNYEERIIGMGNDEFLRICKAKVADYFNQQADEKSITVNDVFAVWSCKTLQNNKALLSTTVSDGMYYELTYNGDKHELYFDAYKKWQNICYLL